MQILSRLLQQFILMEFKFSLYQFDLIVSIYCYKNNELNLSGFE